MEATVGGIIFIKYIYSYSWVWLIKAQCKKLRNITKNMGYS